MKFEKMELFRELEELFLLEEIKGEEVFREYISDYDSLKGFTILSVVEAKFNVEIEIDKFLLMRTFNDVADYIERA